MRCRIICWFWVNNQSTRIHFEASLVHVVHSVFQLPNKPMRQSDKWRKQVRAYLVPSILFNTEIVSLLIGSYSTFDKQSFTSQSSLVRLCVLHIMYYANSGRPVQFSTDYIFSRLSNNRIFARWRKILQAFSFCDFLSWEWKKEKPDRNSKFDCSFSSRTLMDLKSRGKCNASQQWA